MSCKPGDITGGVRVSFQFRLLWTSSTYLMNHSSALTWSPLATTCAVLNIESTKLGIVGVLLTDIVLLLIMFIGLLRFRSDGGGTFGLGLLLWKQVR
jgi:hypothetical protein